jgi:putative glycosyltransferase (TIGR04372 family)
MKVIENFLREVINFFFILFLLPVCLLNFFINYKTIINSDLVIYHKNGGFGHTFTAQDLIRYIFPDKKIIYLQFYDPSRFNLHLNEIFSLKVITLPTAIYFNFKEKKIKFGEYEGSFFNIIEKIIVFFLKKKMSIHEFYKLIEKKYITYPVKKTSQHRFVDIYFFLLKKKKLDLNFTDNIYNSFKKKKICTIYLRQKYSANDPSSSLRSGDPNPRIYFDMINYLIKKNYIIYLVGDNLFTKEDIKIFNGKVMDYRSFNLNKKYFQIYGALNCDLFISEAGGGSWFGSYAKKSILINCLPYGYKPFNFKKILYKKVVDRNNIVMSYKKANKNFYLSYEKIKNYKVINNSSKELLKIVKSVV